MQVSLVETANKEGEFIPEKLPPTVNIGFTIPTEKHITINYIEASTKEGEFLPGQLPNEVQPSFTIPTVEYIVVESTETAVKEDDLKRDKSPTTATADFSVPTEEHVIISEVETGSREGEFVPGKLPNEVQPKVSIPLEEHLTILSTEAVIVPSELFTETIPLASQADVRIPTEEHVQVSLVETSTKEEEKPEEAKIEVPEKRPEVKELADIKLKPKKKKEVPKEEPKPMELTKIKLKPTPKPPPVEEIVEEIEITEEYQEQIPGKPKKEKPAEVPVEETFQITLQPEEEDIPEPEDTEESFQIPLTRKKKKKPRDEGEAKLFIEEEIEEVREVITYEYSEDAPEGEQEDILPMPEDKGMPVTTVVRKIKKPEKEEEEETTLIMKPKPKPEESVEEAEIVLKKKPEVEEEIADITIKKVEKEEIPETAEEKITLKPKKKKKEEAPREEDVDVSFKLEKPKETPKEEENAELLIKKEVVPEEKPEEVEETITVKPKKVKEVPVEDVETSFKLEKPKEKPQFIEEESTEITIQKPVIQEVEAPESVEEKFTLKPKKPKKKEIEEKDVEASFKMEKPKLKIKTVEEAEAIIQLAEEEKPESPEDTSVALTIGKKPKPKKVKPKVIEKAPEETPEETLVFKIEEKKEEYKITEAAVEETVKKEVIVEKEVIIEEEGPIEQTIEFIEPKKTEYEEGKVVLSFKKTITEEKVTVKKPEAAEITTVEETFDVKKKPKKDVPEEEDVEATFKVGKPRKRPEKVEEAEAVIQLPEEEKKPVEPEDTSVALTIGKKPKPKKVKPKVTEKAPEETPEETLVFKIEEKKEEYKITEEAVEETVRKEVIVEKEVIIEEEGPIEQTIEFIEPKKTEYEEGKVILSFKKITEEKITVKIPEAAEITPVEETFDVKKKPKKDVPEDEEVETTFKVGKPRKRPEKVEEAEARIQLPEEEEKPVEPEDTSVALTIGKKPKPKKVKPKVTEKAPEETPEETLVFKIEEKKEEYKITEEAVEETVRKEVIVEKEVIIEEEGPIEQTIDIIETKKTEDEEDKIVLSFKRTVTEEKVTVKKPESPEPVPVEEAFDIKKKPKKPKPEDEDVEAIFKLGKPKKKPEEVEEAEAKIQLPEEEKPQEPEETSVALTIEKKPKPKKVKPKLIQEAPEETPEETLVFKIEEKKEEYKITEEAVEKTVKKEVIVEKEVIIEEEGPIEQTIDIIEHKRTEDEEDKVVLSFKRTVTEEKVSFKKPESPEPAPVEEAFDIKKRPKKPKPEDEEVDATFKLGKPKKKPEEVEEAEARIQLPEEEKPQIPEDTSVALTIEKKPKPKKVKPKVTADTPEETSEDTFVYKIEEKKVEYKITEEAVEETVRKEVIVEKEVVIEEEGPIEQTIDIIEPKKSEDEEDKVILSFKKTIPAKKPRKPEEGPMEETFAVTLEPEEKTREKPEDVETQLTIQPKKKKPAKKVVIKDDEEESLSLELPAEKPEPKYEEAEETAKVIIPRKEITEAHLEELTELDQFVAMTTYTSETQETLSIVEGERVYVIERTRGDFWFVKKYLTHEAGFVPSTLLQDVVSYTHYMKEKIEEKIKKLPVFDKPKPGEKLVPPKFVKKLQPTRVQDGQTAQMECQVSGNPRPNVTWFRQTQIIKPSSEFQIFYDEDNVTTLIIREVFPEDAGTFTVVAKNTAGFASCSAEFIVEAPLSDHGSDLSTPMSRRSLSRESSLADILEGIPPVFAQKPKNQTVDEESTVELTCKVAGVPEPSVTWFHNGKPLEETDHIHSRTEWDVHMNIVIVTIKNIRPEDAGVYDVVAENTEGKAVTSLTLTVKELPKKPKEEPPVFTQTFSDVTVMEKETVVLTTKVQGLPPPEVTWYKDGKKLKPGKNVEEDHDKDKHTLKVTKCSPEKDTGDYKCLAKNPVGKVEHTARVTVQKSGVEFLEKMADVEVKERESAIFVSCVSQEDAEVTWHKDGEQIKPGDKYEFVKEGKFRKLIIRKSVLNDEGEYTCVLGDKECTADLVVVELPPEIVSDMTDVTIPKSETATFQVELTKGDALVKWYKDGKEIMFSEHTQLKIDGKKQKLIISNATFEDMGTYSCVVGQKKSTAKLKVEEPTVEFTAKLPEKIRVPQDTDATFTVELSAPNVDVQWLRNGQPVTEDEGKLIFYQESTVRKMVIRHVSVDDTAEYTCQAGNVQTSTKLHVEEVSAEFTLKLRDIVVRESDVVTLLVEVTRETFEVIWMKDGQELEPTSRLIMEREGRQRKLIIQEALLEDRGIYTCSLLDKYCSSQVNVEAPPRIVKEERVFRVKRGGNVSMDIPFVALPSPKVEWFFNGKPLTPGKKVSLENYSTKTTVNVRKVEDPETGTYTLKLKNKYGECSTDFTISIIDKPKPPGTPEASDVGTDSLTLSWKEPENDGGCPITNYLVEFHDRSTLRWTTLNEEFNIPDTNYRVTDLKPSSEYMFRVTAVNEVGKSDPSPGTKYIPVQEQKGGAPPVVVQHLKNVTAGLKSTAVLECKIAGQPTPTIKWLKNGKDLMMLKGMKTTFDDQVAKLTIGETTSKTSGTFTCKATNNLGAAESTCTVTVQEPPRAEFPETMKNVRVKSGTEYVLDVKTHGFPTPETTWLKNGIPLESSKHTLVQINEMTTCITIRSAEGPDTGTYTLKLHNNAGTVTYDFQLRVLDKPGPPEAPITFPRRDKESITLSWLPPTDDGGSTITQYVVEKCDTKRKIWFEVTTVPGDTTVYTVQDLTEGNEYIFKVSAVNEYGRGQPLQSEPAQARSMFDKPSPPKGPLQASNMTDTSFTLSWQPPENDGGCPILEYVVERRETGRKAWQKVGTSDGRTTNLDVTGLKKQTPYQFRITCTNDVGTSLPLAPEQTFTPGVAMAPPTAPLGPLTVVSMTNKTITISWHPPANTNVSDLTGYTVEKRETRTETWTRLETLDPQRTTYTVQNLSERYEYYFRICAENPAGLSPPLENDKPIRLATTAERPSPPTDPLEMRATGPSSIMIEWGRPESDGGAPLTGYTIALRDTRRIMWMEVGQVDGETQRLHIKDVQEGHEYMVRIMAHNEVGLSDPLESEEPIKVIRPPGFKESFLAELDDATPSVSFSTETSSSWIREAHVEPLLRSYTKHVLIGRNEYFFRVWHYADTLFK